MSKVQVQAYTIPLLHAAKYPSSAVCGVLLGTNTPDGVQVNTAVPFFHHWTTVTPMLEVALKQTDIYAKQNSLSIVGWYQANASAEDNALPERAIKVGETIRKNNGNKALIFLLDNKQFSELNESAITPFVFTENQWRKVKEAFQGPEVRLVEEEETISKARELFSSSAYTRLHDFDEHVENVSLDWLNTSKLVL
ncbi:hypothetical protein INT47_013054 [Mucor saturninus]|uniref:MPN domain-containing protein n=1 Tax=Mucor saturninus TaxID=64648 RepID=A0A8H7UY13_9FUNG|nr:hypothetical protein INT47_013054 [Mucor saturninus]